MFRALVCPSSGVCDYVVELPHWLISFLVCCVLELGCGSARVASFAPSSLYNRKVFSDLSFGRVMCLVCASFVPSVSWHLLYWTEV